MHIQFHEQAVYEKGTKMIKALLKLKIFSNVQEKYNDETKSTANIGVSLLFSKQCQKGNLVDSGIVKWPQCDP